MTDINAEGIALQKLVMRGSGSVAHNSAQHNTTADNCLFEELLSISKRQGLSQPCSPNMCYVPKVDLNDMYLDFVIIHTGRAPHKLSKKVDRLEIHVYMDVPISSVRLKAII